MRSFKFAGLFALVFLPFLCHALFSDPLVFTSGPLWPPDENGDFIEGTPGGVGNAVTANYVIVSKDEFDAYVGCDAKIYADWKKGLFNGGEQSGPIVSEPDWLDEDLCTANWEYCEMSTPTRGVPICFLAIYEISANGRDYYIAKACSATKWDSPVISDGNFTEIAANAGRWTLVAPSEPLTISCVGLAVTSGVVTATFSISDTSRYGEIISNGMATVTVATDLAGTDRHGLSASATTDASSGTFTVVFPVPSNTSRLFIFGVQ